jgi:uncharacterized protein YcbK (DUF882 family)
MVHSYPKHSDESLSKDFKVSEFACPCDHCEETLIDDELVLRLQELREALGFPLKITSGYRCEHHQEELREMGFETAVGKSQHELGRAADVKTGHHLGIEIEEAARSVGFKAVGVGKAWAHVDLRDDRDRRWKYSY